MMIRSEDHVFSGVEPLQPRSVYIYGAPTLEARTSRRKRGGARSEMCNTSGREADGEGAASAAPHAQACAARCAWRRIGAAVARDRGGSGTWGRVDVERGGAWTCRREEKNGSTRESHDRWTTEGESRDDRDAKAGHAASHERDPPHAALTVRTNGAEKKRWWWWFVGGGGGG